MPNIQPLDWSATAAWIALIISVAGTIASPLITTFLTNRHQLKLRELDLKQKQIDEYESTRFGTINSFISDTGKCLAHHDAESLKSFGQSYHSVYTYVPESLWDELDSLYLLICAYEWGQARDKFPNIVHQLAELLKETHQ